MRLKVKASVVAMILAVGFPATALGPVPDTLAPEFSGQTTAGETVALSDFRGEWVMLEWTNHDCPYVKKHYSSGNMQRTQQTLTEEGVTWISIISSAPGTQGYVTAEEADTLSASRGVYADMVILDPKGTIGRLYEAKTTPQMFLIDPDGMLKYMGAIDDKPSSRQSSLEGATNYALKAWEAVNSGKEVMPKSTQPYGCSVKYAE